jgi:hypothetical protein
VPGDPLWNLLSAGLHLSGSHGATSFPDVKGHSFTRTGNVTISTAQNRFAGGEGSAYFPGGASDRIVASASPDFSFTGTSLSISASIYPLAMPPGPGDNHCRLVLIGINSSSTAFCLDINTAGAFGVYVPLSGRNNLFTPNGVLTLNAWQDLEVSVFNRTCLLFLNGNLLASMANLDMPVAGNNPVKIGGDQSGYPSVDTPFTGYVSNLRILCKAGRHGSSYAPDTQPFPEGLELPQAVRARDPQPGIRSPAPAWKAVRSPAGSLLFDAEHGGRGRIVGTVKAKGETNYPVARRVRLLRKRDGALARETWSDAAGNYVFDHIRHDVVYILMSHDHTGLYNAVIDDAITPDLIP